jgi:hypothetical protein
VVASERRAVDVILAGLTFVDVGWYAAAALLAVGGAAYVLTGDRR